MLVCVAKLLIRWCKELSVTEDQVSDMKMPQADAQTEETVGWTCETDLVLVPQETQVCALEIDQGTSLQTGQVSIFSSLVAGCKAGDG